MKLYKAFKSVIVLSLISSSSIALADTSSCITSSLLNLNGTHTKVIPFGCSFTSSTSFSFKNVLDNNSIAHLITIDAFEQFASNHGVGGVFISGAIDTATFSGIGIENHPADTLGKVILPVPTANYPVTLTSELITPVTLPANFLIQLDPNKVSSGTYSVAAYGAPVNGVQSYQVTENFSLFFQASLDGGKSWVSEDPAFSLSTFVESANPQIQAYILSSVPEPETYAMMLAGLGMMGFMVRRRNNEQA